MTTIHQIFQHSLFIPLLSVIGGALILIFPRLLNILVGLYLLVMGILGLVQYFR